MKTTSLLGRGKISLILKFFSSLFIVMLLISCSSDNISTDQTEGDLQSADAKGFKYETWQDQIARLDQKMRRFENFQVAMAQGWDEDLTGFIPNMGHHYLNGELLDGTFDLLNPETLLYVQDENGEWQFVGVEYLILMEALDDPSTPPEGFIGDDDEWVIVGPFWTLHAWVGIENPAGIFNPTNPDVPSEE